MARTGRLAAREHAPLCQKDFEMIWEMKPRSHGFTLLEALFCVTILALMVLGFSAIYDSGFRSLNAQADRLLLDSRLRGRMEFLVSTSFGALSDGSEVVNINGNSHTITWTVVPVDLNGDGAAEPRTKQVTVSVSGFPDRSLTVILVDNEGKLGKL